MSARGNGNGNDIGECSECHDSIGCHMAISLSWSGVSPSSWGARSNWLCWGTPEECKEDAWVVQLYRAFFLRIRDQCHTGGQTTERL